MKYLAALVIWIGVMTSSQAFADLLAQFDLDDSEFVPISECQKATFAKGAIVIQRTNSLPYHHYVLLGKHPNYVLYDMELDGSFDKELKCKVYRVTE